MGAEPEDDFPVQDAPFQATGSKYDPAFCKMVIELGNQGQTFKEIASHVGVHYDTFLEWAKAHPEFKAAKAFAKQGQENFMTRLMRKNFVTTKGTFYNQTSVIFWMKNCHGWRDDVHMNPDEETELEFYD